MLWQEVSPVCFRVANDLVIHKKIERKGLGGYGKDCAGKTALISQGEQMTSLICCPPLATIFDAPVVLETCGGNFEAVQGTTQCVAEGT